jgi:hypothetical protein
MTLLTILAHAESDLRIPARAAILARCHELRADALRMADTATAQQLKLLIDALDGGIEMVWTMGDLLVSSASAAGRVYMVSCGVCNCPARKPCKHLKLVEVLLDMLDTAAGDADLEADCDEMAAQPWTIGALAQRRMAATTPIKVRIVAARASCWATL